MKRYILIFNTLLFISCGTMPKPSIENTYKEKTESTATDLSKKDLKLKIGSLWYSDEEKVHLVYGINEENTDANYITELHFNFGGNINCENKTLSAIFDFENSTELILPDSINKLLPATKNIFERKQKGSSVEFVFKNPNPGILISSIEKINLKPNRKKSNVNLKVKSQCFEYLNLPLTLIKYNASELDELVSEYITNELNALSEDELKKLKVVFSYNPIYKTEKYLIDMVDQGNMQILFYNSDSKEYVLTDFRKNVIKKVKRRT